MGTVLELNCTPFSRQIKILNGGAVFMLKYSEDFKLEVVNSYFNTKLGIRLTARAFNLPSKNLVENWIKQLKKKGLIPMDKEKTINKSSVKSNNSKEDDKNQTDMKTAREKQLEKENLRLKAEIDYLKKLKQLQRRNVQEN